MNREATSMHGMHAERAEPNASVDTIEAMLAANRAALDHTLSELEQRISMQGLFNEATERLRTQGGEFLRNLRDSAAYNPLPIALAAIGLAWAAFSDNSARSGSSGMRFGNAQEKATGAAQRARGAVAGAKEGAAQRLGAAKARGRDLAGRGGEAMSSARERATELGSDAAERARRSMEQTRYFAREYPIITAGAGLALGAALAALLPATEFENEKLGPAKDRAMRQARNAAAEVGKGAKEGAKEEPLGSGMGRDQRREDEAGLPGLSGDGSSGGRTHIRT